MLVDPPAATIFLRVAPLWIVRHGCDDFDCMAARGQVFSNPCCERGNASVLRCILHAAEDDSHAPTVAGPFVCVTRPSGSHPPCLRRLSSSSDEHSSCRGASSAARASCLMHLADGGVPLAGY